MLLIEDRLEAARTHLKAGRDDSAQLLYESILDFNPRHKEALKALCALMLKRGETDKMLSFAERALAEGADAEILAMTAQALLMAGQRERASAAVDQALTLAPEQPEAARIKSMLLAEAGDRPAAERLLVSAIDKHPQRTDLLAALSQIYFEDGLFAPALHYTRRALALKPDSLEIMAALGLQLSALGEHREALGFLEKVHLGSPENLAVTACLAETQAQVGELSEARRLAKRVLTLDPSSLPGWRSYIGVMALRGEGPAALAEFIPVARQHKERSAAVITLAAAYRLLGDPAQALKLLQPLIPRAASLPRVEKMQVMKLARDCALSLGLFEAVPATFAGFDLRVALGLPVRSQDDDAATDGGQSPSLEATLADAVIVADAGVSPLEALALLRFRPGGERKDAPVTVHGPSSLAGLVELMPGRRFHANDIGRKDPTGRVIRALPAWALLALPAELRGEIAAPIPYLRAPADRAEIWRRSLRDLPRPLVGLTWSETRPGLVLADFGAAFDGFKGTIVSLVWDEARHQLASWPNVIDAGIHFASLGDLAAVVAEMDLVVGPDGIPLHVAGGLGVSGVVLGAPNLAWYWHHGEDGKAVWYPSVAVLRAGIFGNWTEVMAQLAARLRGAASPAQPVGPKAGEAAH